MYCGQKKGRQAWEYKGQKIEPGEKRLTDTTTSVMNWKKIHRYWGAGEVDERGEGNLWVEEKNKKNWNGSGRKRTGEGNLG